MVRFNATEIRNSLFVIIFSFTSAMIMNHTQVLISLKNKKINGLLMNRIIGGHPANHSNFV